MPGVDLIRPKVIRLVPIRKIIVHRPEVGDPPELVDPIIATVGSLTVEGVPSFDHEDIAGIADFIAPGGAAIPAGIRVGEGEWWSNV